MSSSLREKVKMFDADLPLERAPHDSKPVVLRPGNPRRGVPGGLWQYLADGRPPRSGWPSRVVTSPWTLPVNR